MNQPQDQTGLCVRLRSGQGKTEVRINLSWRCRISGIAAARLLIALVLMLTATAVAMPAHDDLARGVLSSLAVVLAGSRPRIRP
ncbi:MAG TPA: hypothetical protein VF070_31700 [Streptosporangiaceae bacterium]